MDEKRNTQPDDVVNRLSLFDGDDDELRPLIEKSYAGLAGLLQRKGKVLQELPSESGRTRSTRACFGLVLQETGAVLSAALAQDEAKFESALAGLAHAVAWTASAHGVNLPPGKTCSACKGSGDPEDGECARGCSACGGLGYVKDALRQEPV
jgi:hypothetical protein